MLVARPRLHPMAAAAIRTLESKGLTPTAAHIIWLQDAASQIRKQARRRVCTLIDWPIKCGNVFLYPMSFAGIEWWQRMDDDLRGDIFVQAFVCAHTNDKALMEKLQDAIDIMGAVKKWRNTITVSPVALAEAVNDVMGYGEDFCHVEVTTAKKETPREDRATTADYGAFVVALVRKYPGTTPDYWALEVSREFALDKLSDDPGESQSKQVTGHEIEMNAMFRAVVAKITSELSEVSNG